MAIRCQNCNKFAAYDTETDPDVESVEINEDGEITGTVRITNVCADCNDELTESTFDIVANVEIPDEHKGEGHELDVDAGDASRVEKTEGKGRGMKRFYGAAITFGVTCSCGKFNESVNWEDYVQASHMDPLN